MSQRDMRDHTYTGKSTSGKNNAFVYGNAVRRMEAAPEYKPGRQVPVRTPQGEHARRQRQIAAKRNLQRAQMMNGRYIMFLAAATLVCALFCGMFIHMQADITKNMESVAALETEISDLKADNDAVEKRLGTTMSLSDVKDRAVKELGMTYPTSGQIIEFSVENTDYMNQYSSVPEH